MLRPGRRTEAMGDMSSRMGRAVRRRRGGGEMDIGEDEMVLSGGRDEKRRRRWIDSAKW